MTKLTYIYGTTCINGVIQLFKRPVAKKINIEINNLYVDTFVTIAFYCMYMCMNFVDSCV